MPYFVDFCRNRRLRAFYKKFIKNICNLDVQNDREEGGGGSTAF